MPCFRRRLLKQDETVLQPLMTKVGLRHETASTEEPNFNNCNNFCFFDFIKVVLSIAFVLSKYTLGKNSYPP